MRKPDLKEEKKLWKKGYPIVAGLDEVGRGPLAGPVVAAAVVINNSRFKIQDQGTKQKVLCSAEPINMGSGSKFKIKNLKDSKKLSPKTREKLFKILTAHPAIEWGIGKVSEKTIDKINILEATRLAMQKAVANLNCPPDYLILDGNIKINLAMPQKAIVKADEKVFSCAAASIIAKVTRDRLMCRFAKKYPRYGFEKHKGYGTEKHVKILKKIGPCKIHRLSFRSVKARLA